MTQTIHLHTLISPKDLPDFSHPHAAVVAIDALRATTVMVTAFSVGVSEIYPVTSVEEAFQLHRDHPQWILAGEVGGLPPEGFHYGNSPITLVENKETFQSKTLIMSTTNGTRLLKTLEARIQFPESQQVLVGAMSNAQAVADYLKTQAFQHIYFCCAGQKGNIGLEDIVTAGAMIKSLLTGKTEVNSAFETSEGSKLALSLLNAYGGSALEVFEDSHHGQELLALGLGEDLTYCAQANLSQCVPIFHEGRVFVASNLEKAEPASISLKSGGVQS
ncbi:MAG: 2-phosphosulfolactate phosphatase [Cyanobacteria bacterium]|nr:2-phosphosulfolactate phosphatase [Cyanobacteriota bacterium]